jgi:UMF1 family MFS transporter
VLAACLWWIQTSGLPTQQSVPQTMLITAAAFALASLPTMLLLRERARPQPVGNTEVWRIARARVRDALRGGHGLVDLRRFLWCIVAYQAGVQTVIALAAIYTEQALGFSTQDSIKLILLVNLTAAAGAFVFGLIQDRLGHRLTLAITLVGWLLAIALLLVADTRPMVWLAANVAGLCLGASQSAGRALVGYLCPPAREAEIFGLWGLAVKAASILGPLSYGIVNAVTHGDHKVSIAFTAVFFVAGLALLTRVDVARGHAAARGNERATGK